MPIGGHLRRIEPDFADKSGNVEPNWAELRHFETSLDGMKHEFQATRAFRQGPAGSSEGCLPLDASARGPHDELAIQQNVSIDPIGILDAIEHCGYSGLPDLAARLMNGGQGHGEKLGIFHIINAQDSEIARNFISQRQQPLHKPSGGAVVDTNKGVGAKIVQHLFERTIGDGGHALHGMGFKGKVGGKKRFTKPCSLSSRTARPTVILEGPNWRTSAASLGSFCPGA